MTPLAAVTEVDPMSADLLPALGLTWCNEFARRVCSKLGVQLGGVFANEQCQWLRSEAAEYVGWRRLTHESVARAAANAGSLVLATWENPAGHGHIAVLIPSPDATTLIAQAGGVNSASIPLHDPHTFGSLPVELHVFQPVVSESTP